MTTEAADAPDRRPIAARGLGASRFLATSLARVGVTPNQISVLGMLFGVGAGVALGFTSVAPGVWWRLLFVAGAALVVLRLACNMLDGMVAVEQKSCSPLGELYNEIPDRVSDTATLVGFGYALGGFAALGYIAALLAMFTAYIRATGKAAGAKQQFCGPMSKPQRMFTVVVVSIYCAATPLIWQTGGKLGAPGWALLLICAGALVASARRLLRIRHELKRATS